MQQQNQIGGNTLVKGRKTVWNYNYPNLNLIESLEDSSSNKNIALIYVNVL